MMMRKKASSTYGVYIIESLRKNDFRDGHVLDQILNLTGIPTLYFYADTVDDFKRLVEDFKISQFRYLHISCHADKTGFEINGEDFFNEDFERLFDKGLINKRVFMSACEGANRDLACRLIRNCGAYSLIGTPIGLDFDKSVLFWPSFYHIIFKNDKTKMSRRELINSLQKCVDLFKVPINYYSRIDSNLKHIRRLKIREGKQTDDRMLLIKV